MKVKERRFVVRRDDKRLVLISIFEIANTILHWKITSEALVHEEEFLSDDLSIERKLQELFRSVLYEVDMEGLQ